MEKKCLEFLHIFLTLLKIFDMLDWNFYKGIIKDSKNIHIFSEWISNGENYIPHIIYELFIWNVLQNVVKKH